MLSAANLAAHDLNGLLPLCSTVPEIVNMSLKAPSASAASILLKHLT